MSESSPLTPFVVKDCVLVAYSTALRARSLSEFRDKLAVVNADSLYHHFWGERLRPHFEHPEYHNDFAAWAQTALNRPQLAERLSVIDPTEYNDLEVLRKDLLEIVDHVLDDQETDTYVPRSDTFNFVQSNLLIFDTRLTTQNPRDLPTLVTQMSTESIFYHFIDATRRTPDHCDDFSYWLKQAGDVHQELIDELREIDYYFFSLSELKKKIAKVMTLYFLEFDQSPSK